MDQYVEILKAIHQYNKKGYHEWVELKDIKTMLASYSQNELDTLLRELFESKHIEFPKGGESIRNCFRLTLSGKEKAKLAIYGGPYLEPVPKKLQAIENEIDDLYKKLPKIGNDSIVANFIKSRIARLESARSSRLTGKTNRKTWISLAIAIASLLFSILYNIFLNK